MRTRLIMLWMLLACSAGCMKGTDPGLVPASGVVRWQGKPLEGARVIFHPAHGRPAQGTTDAGGRFQLSTLRAGDGALAGLHRATVIASSEPQMMPGSAAPTKAAPKAESLERYANPDTSGLEYEVSKAAENHFVLELE